MRVLSDLNGIAFDALFDASPNPYVLLDPSFTIVGMNEAYLRVTMRERTELIGRNMFEAFPSDPCSESGRQLRESLTRTVRDRRQDHLPLIHYAIPRLDGREYDDRYWSATHTPLLNQAGEVILILQHTVDVTELHRLRTVTTAPPSSTTYSTQIAGTVLQRAQNAETTWRALAEERDQLRRLFEQAPGFMAVLSGPEHVFTLANSTYSALVGHREVVGMSVRAALPEVGAQGFLDLLDHVYASGQPYVGRSMRVLLQARPGAPEEERYLDFVYQPILDAEGAVSGIFVQGHDLTEQKRAEQALQESEERFRLVAESAPVMLWMGDTEGKCLYLNRAAREFWGVTLDDIAQFDWSQTLHPADAEKLFGPYRLAMQSHTPFTVEARFQRHDGEYRIVHTDAQPRLGAGGEFAGMIGVNVDITETRRAEEALQRLNATLEHQVAERTEQLRRNEEALRHAQKLEAVGRLTGGVAHDFNNLLQVIGGNLQLLSNDLAGNPRVEERLRNALHGVSRGSKLASQLLAFGRRQPLLPRVINLGRLLPRLDDMLRRTLGDGIEIEGVIAGNLWRTLADPTQVENALLNLAINARDAMEGQGKLTIEVGNAWLDETYAVRHIDVSPGPYVLLAVTDTGCGMSPEVIEQAFEPFFTTKPEGQGTGLGLSQVYGFVKQSGGHVKIDSEPRRGTTVRIYLPRTLEEEDLATSPDAGPVTGGTETILVVEDDENVRATVVDMLCELGYRVLRAKDGQSALAIVDSGAPIDLLFTDVVMPGPLRSPELARKARQRLPQIAVLFTSGYTDDAIVHGGRLDEGVELLSKPYAFEALARKVRDVLQSRRNADCASASQPAPSETVPLPADDGRDGRLRVLLVEDDALIRMSTVDMLADMGHQVSEAGDAATALALLDGHAFDVLLTDVSLPGMSGGELAVEACRRCPGVRVVFASGYDVVPAGPGNAPLDNAVLLRKPYYDAELAEALDRAMA